MFRFWLVALIVSLVLSPGALAEIRQIKFSGLGNFKALYGVPEGDPPFPVVIYHYDPFLDWRGIRFAASKGYDIYQIIEAFNDRGYAVLVPIERYRKIEAIRSGVIFLSRDDSVDNRQIHFLGLSEGGFMALLALQKLPFIRSAVISNPRPLNDKGYFSMRSFFSQVNNIRTPILFYMSNPETKRSHSQALQMFHVLRNSGREIYMKTVPRSSQWFWNPSSEYLEPILTFFEDNR